MRKTSLNTIYELAKEDKRVIFIGSDLGAGVLDDFKKNIPERFFMEGIAEQHIIGMSSGLAMDGYIPYVNTIATFLTRRCYEQIAVDLCLHDLPVRLIANGGGYVYAPLGPTHQAIEDISIMRSLPNMTVIAPCDAIEMKKIIVSTLNWPHPIYIRLAKGGDRIISSEDELISIGKGVIFKEPGDGLFITTGIMTQVAIEASEILNQEGFSTGVLHLHTIKPLDHQKLKDILPNVKKIITVEEHTLIGGLGSSILEFCSDNLPGSLDKILRLGLPDRFSENYGSQNQLLESVGLTSESLYHKMRNQLENL
ncbi:MAG: transketolase [Gammaproteobacteria bacterium]|nr:transketolase [Gammaproteobacteria bacterium]